MKRITTGQHITKGQRAAVCALILAGISFTKACEIVSAQPKAMSKHVPKDWRNRLSPKRRWKGDLLAEVKEAWLDRAQRTETIADRYGVTPSQIHNIACREGWPMRPTGPAPNPCSLRQQPRDKFLYYRKLIRCGYSRDEAKENL
jgi:hypothetical protein